MGKIIKYIRVMFSAVLWRQARVSLIHFLSGNVSQIINIGALGKNSVIMPSARLANSQNIFIGDNSEVSRSVFVWAGPNSKIVMGNQSGLSPGTFVTSDNHSTRAGIPFMDQPGDEKDVIIGNDVWVGAN